MCIDKKIYGNQNKIEIYNENISDQLADFIPSKCDLERSCNTTFKRK